MVLRHRHFGADDCHIRLRNVCFRRIIPPFGPSVLTSCPLLSYIFANFQTKEIPNNAPPSKTVPTFLALYSFGFIYELVLVWDALRLKNTIQIIGLCLCNIGLLIYGAVQVEQIRTSINTLAENNKIDSVVWSQSEPFLIIIPCIVALGTLLMSFVAWKLYDEFAWTIYKHISADLRMKRRYLTYQVGILVCHICQFSILTWSRFTSLSSNSISSSSLALLFSSWLSCHHPRMTPNSISLLSLFRSRSLFLPAVPGSCDGSQWSA